MLNERWKIGAQHVLHHHEGDWYHVLQHFPGVYTCGIGPYYDGYVIFRTKEDYDNCEALEINEETNTVHVKDGHTIRDIPNYRVPGPIRKFLKYWMNYVLNNPY